MDDGTFAAGGALKNTVEERVCDGKAACGRICESAGVARVGGGGLGLRWSVCLGFFLLDEGDLLRRLSCCVFVAFRACSAFSGLACFLPCCFASLSLPPAA